MKKLTLIIVVAVVVGILALAARAPESSMSIQGRSRWVIVLYESPSPWYWGFEGEIHVKQDTQTASIGQSKIHVLGDTWYAEVNPGEKSFKIWSSGARRQEIAQIESPGVTAKASFTRQEDTQTRLVTFEIADSILTVSETVE